MTNTGAIDVSVTAFRRYLEAVKAGSTGRKYAEYAASFLRLMRSNGYQTFEEIPPGLLGEYAAMQIREGKAATTVRVHVFAVKKYLEWVEGQGVPVAKQRTPDLPKVEVRVRDALEPEHFTAYFRQADVELEEPIRTAVMLLPCAGLRGNEMVSVKLSDIRRAVVQLQNGKKIKTLFLRIVGKGNKQRDVPLMAEGVQILTGYLTGWRARRGGPWLFPKPTRKRVNLGKKHVSDRYLRAALQQMREPLGMEFTPHTMRRTYVTTMYRKGVPIKTISNAVGHANIQTTIDHYIVPEQNENVKALHDAGASLFQ